MRTFLQPLRAISFTVSCNSVSCVDEAVGEGAGLLLRFEDLAEVVLGEDDGVFLLHGVHHGEANVEQIGAERQVRAVLFDDAEGQHAHPLRLVDGLNEVRGGEFFPLGGELGLRDGMEG